GAVTALNSVGYNLGGDGKSIPVFGVDATDAAKSLIKDKRMAGTIKQDAEGMAMAIGKLTANCIEGKEILADTTDLNKDEGVAKIRIAYAKYLGE
ncbi:MAG: galactose ABC transporter substrate-binding protein, partial [Clostridia bacterium]|nr:galactose ABC transporter substrate-binding protein [Clostridia bacterium]